MNSKIPAEVAGQATEDARLPVDDAFTASQIQREVDELRARAPDTRTLYREVCALLFLRHNITPTAALLYRYVRKGSMSVPAEELARFWDGLRAKVHPQIHHAALPERLRDTAVQALAEIWRQACEAATEDFAGARQEIHRQVQAARDEVAQIQVEMAQTQEQLRQALEDAANLQAGLREQLAVALQERDGLRRELDEEKQAHAGTSGRLIELQDQLQRQQAVAAQERDTARAQLAQAREDVQKAIERSEAATRRAALEIDQERQARLRTEQLAQSLRGQVSDLEAQERQRSAEQAEQLAHWQSKAESATSVAAHVRQSNESLTREVDDLRAQLSAAREEGARHQTEAQVTQRLLEELHARMDSLTLPSRTTRQRTVTAKEQAPPEN